MSMTLGSMLNFLPSLIFTFSSISSLITSCRLGILCVVRMVELGALLDVEIGDRIAVDHDGDGLGTRRRGRSASQDQRPALAGEAKGGRQGIGSSCVIVASSDHDDPAIGISWIRQALQQPHYWKAAEPLMLLGSRACADRAGT